MVRGTGHGMGQWPVTAADVFTGLADWRAAHSQATLREIEGALDWTCSRTGNAGGKKYIPARVNRDIKIVEPHRSQSV